MIIWSLQPNSGSKSASLLSALCASRAFLPALHPISLNCIFFVNLAGHDVLFSVELSICLSDKGKTVQTEGSPSTPLSPSSVFWSWGREGKALHPGTLTPNSGKESYFSVLYMDQIQSLVSPSQGVLEVRM